MHLFYYYLTLHISATVIFTVHNIVSKSTYMTDLLFYFYSIFILCSLAFN
jgi:hypothetical protein